MLDSTSNCIVCFAGEFEINHIPQVHILNTSTNFYNRLFVATVLRNRFAYLFIFGVINWLRSSYRVVFCKKSVMKIFTKHLCGSPFWIKLQSRGNYVFKVNNRNPRARCDLYWKLTIKTPDRHRSRHSSVFTVNFQHISYLVLAFLLLPLSR